MKINQLFLPLLLGFSACSVIGVVKPAHAWFKVCNQSSKRAHVAFAYHNVSDNRARPHPVAGGSAWTSEGWWTLNAGQCAEVYPHELWRRNRYYYVYAESDGRRTIWGGNKLFCVARGSAFRIMQADLPVNTAPSGNAINGCAGSVLESQIQRVGFDEVDIRGRTQNFTYRLND